MTFFQPNSLFTRVDCIVADTYNAEFYPYRVEINPEVQSNPPTDIEINEVHCLATPEKENSDLKERVKKIPGQDGQFIVDKFFQIINAPDRIAHTKEVYQKWSSFSFSSQTRIAFGSIILVASTILICKGPDIADSSLGSFFIGFLGCSGFVGSCTVIGVSYARAVYADRQCMLWKNPGLDFAERRSVALKLSLSEILQQKCRFNTSAPQNDVLSKKPLKPVNTKGTLLPIEILSVWKKVVIKMGDSLLTRQPTSLEDLQQWVKEFCALDILTVEFFNEDPEILQTRAWAEVHQFFKSYQNFKQSIEEFQQGISERIVALQDIKKKIEEVAKEILGKIGKISDRYSVNQIEEYRSLIMEACRLEMEPTLNAIKQEQSRLSCPLAIFYWKSREFLKNVRKKLIENQSVIDLTDGQNPKTSYLPSELLKLDRKIIQLILNRAKRLRSSDHEFLSFIDKLSTI